MDGYTEIPLTCSSCGGEGTYTLGLHEDDIVCVVGACGHTLNYVDLQLEPGELVQWNADERLCVYTPVESEHDYGYYPEN